MYSCCAVYTPELHTCIENNASISFERKKLILSSASKRDYFREFGIFFLIILFYRENFCESALSQSLCVLSDSVLKERKWGDLVKKSPGP